MAFSIEANALMDLEVGPLCLVAAVAGVLSHLTIYIRGYRYRQALAIVLTHLALGVALAVLFTRRLGLIPGLRLAAATWLSYHAGLALSISVYRVWFHPLRHIPGPFGANISKLHNVIWAQDGKIHEHHTDWARKWGSAVRIAPNELLLSSVDAIRKVHGPQSKATKADSIYDYLNYKGQPNLDSIADREEHRNRRHVWERALNSKLWATYEQNAREVAHDWLEVMESASAKRETLNSTLYGKLIALDNMGLLGYSARYGTVKSGKEIRTLHLLTVMLGAVGKLCMNPGLIAIAKSLNLSKEQAEFDQLSCEATDKRERELDESENDRGDLMKYFLQDYKSEKPKSFSKKDMVYSDSQAIMIAGADSLGCAISICFYFLARDRGLREKLRKELAPVFGKSMPGEFVDNDLNSLPVLDSIITESLRMHSPICNNGPRVITEDTQIDGVHIPKGTTVIVGIHTIQRSPRYFVKPDEFIAERWTDRPDLVLDKQAWHPFIIGTFNCVGKRVALIVIRMVLAYTVWHYDFQFAPGEDGTAIIRDSENALVLKPGACNCVFTKVDT